MDQLPTIERRLNHGFNKEIRYSWGVGKIISLKKRFLSSWRAKNTGKCDWVHSGMWFCGCSSFGFPIWGYTWAKWVIAYVFWMLMYSIPAYTSYSVASQNRGERGLLSVLRSDKMDFRDEIIKTKYKNVYLMSSSFMDPIEDYLDIRQQGFERVLLTLRTCLIWFWFPYRIIRRLSPVMYPVKNCDMGFIVWSERVDCALNTSKLMTFFSSINIGVAKFSKYHYK